MPRKKRTKKVRGAPPDELGRKSSALASLASVSKGEEEEAVQGEEEDHEKVEPETYDYYEEANEMCLPWEVWVQVLDFLPGADLSRFSQTCRLFYAIADMSMVWRGRAERHCWQEMERWGHLVPDGLSVGWKNLCKSYLRLRWATLRVSDRPFYRDQRKCFTTAKVFMCLAVDEESFAHTPDMVALGNFGCQPATDCVQLWREGEDKQWSLWRGIKGHKNTVSCIKFIDATNRLVTGSWDKYASHACTSLQTYHGGGHKFEVQCIARHGSTLASGAQDKTVALWDMAAGKCVSSFAGHTHFVNCVEFDKEGQVVMSASQDKTIRVWDPRAGPDPVCVHHTNKGLTTLALNADGSRLYYGPSLVNCGTGFWVDMKAGRLHLEPSLCWSDKSQRVASWAQHLAASPIRLSDGSDHLIAGNALITVNLASQSGWAGASVQELESPSCPPVRPALPFDGSRGVCWTSSNALVTGGNNSVFMADMASQCSVPKPPAVRVKRSVSLAQPTAQEVARDVARIQRQIEQLRGKRVPWY